MKKIIEILREMKDMAKGKGKAAPIVRHYPKDKQREDAENMDAGFHMPGITDKPTPKRTRRDD